MKVSVVVPCYQEETHIGACLESLLAQDYPGEAEIIVVDNGSTDGSQALVRGFEGQSPIVRLVVETQRGTAAARNAGLRNASFAHVAFIDADCAAPPGWLSLLAGHFAAAKEDEKSLAGVGGRNIAPPGASPFVRAVEIALDAYPGSFNSVQGRQRRRRAYVPSLSLANAFYEKERLLAVGGFDESLRSEAEDADLNFRLTEAGGRLLYLPDSFVWHNLRASPKSWLRNMFRYGKGRARLLKRHRAMRHPSFLLPPAFLAAMLTVPLAPLSPVFLLPLLYFPLLAGLALRQAVAHRATRLWPLVVLVYGLQHFGYASGEVYGLCHPRVA